MHQIESLRRLSLLFALLTAAPTQANASPTTPNESGEVTGAIVVVPIAPAAVANANAVAPPTPPLLAAAGSTALQLPPNNGLNTNGAGWQEMLDQYERERQAQLAKPAPFGRYPDGSPVAAPAYDAMHSLWKAAIRDPNSGMTQQQFGTLLSGNPSTLEAGLLALANSPWGKEWLSHDENAALIGRNYGLRVLGYWVTRKSNNPDDGFVHLTH